MVPTRRDRSVRTRIVRTRIVRGGEDVPPLHFVEGRKDADFDLLDPARAE
ncbi:hypothetical protein ACFV4P_22925 [Kitasatospora sp. NPDC059795]